MAAQAEVGGGLKQKLVQLRRAFLVAPVADPDQIAFLGGGAGMEQARVGGLMPGPGP